MLGLGLTPLHYLAKYDAWPHGIPSPCGPTRVRTCPWKQVVPCALSAPHLAALASDGEGCAVMHDVATNVPRTGLPAHSRPHLRGAEDLSPSPNVNPGPTLTRLCYPSFKFGLDRLHPARCRRTGGSGASTRPAPPARQLRAFGRADGGPVGSHGRPGGVPAGFACGRSGCRSRAGAGRCCGSSQVWWILPCRCGRAQPIATRMRLWTSSLEI